MSDSLRDVGGIDDDDTEWENDWSEVDLCVHGLVRWGNCWECEADFDNLNWIEDMQ